MQEPGPSAAAAATPPAIPAGAHASGSSTQHVPAHSPADLPQLTPEKSKLLARSIKLEPSVQGEALTPACREALRKLFAYKPCGGENHFRLKINSKWAEQYAPDYFQHIEQPMDLSTMRSKSNAKDPANRYQSIVEFEADLRLIGTNAIAYNGGEHDVAYAAVDLLKYFNESVLPNMQQRGAEAVLDAQLKELHMRVQRQRAQHMRASAGQ